MPKQLDPKIGEILKEHGFGPDACWDCHGTWVVYHHVLEKIAAASDIVFDMPQIVEADAGNKVASMVVSGRLEGRTEWATGEASPANCKNAYPWAMAEKRAKDRVILKLIGLAGLAYSEEEADDFKESKPKFGDGTKKPDDDGNAAGGTITDDQKKILVDLQQEAGADTAAFLKFLRVGSLDALPAARFNEARQALLAKINRGAA